MARYRGKHRKPSTTGRTIARTAVAGAVAGAPLVAIVPSANAASDSTWDRLAQCESSGNWAANTGNGFSGGLQFTKSTWSAFGGGQYAPVAHQASRSEQIAVAEKVLAGQGWGAWPACSKKTGASGSSTPREGAASSGSQSGSTSESKPESKPESKSESNQAPKTVAKKAAPKSKPAAATSSSAGSYTVRSGDTLSEIAASHGIGNWRTIQDKNSFLNGGTLIIPGQRLAL
ncbi:transglycosylase family protein [Pseudonocardia endophytica]|uniref:LysM domain-containing protein n=1 Tax=Pseudonocardia endophytica TaxID=401976 RepID=A0A4R1HH14_PSEEN|nr:transglycosylase family protein [Pseudonocardia endophytica]TCK20063.1 LysM domain-containing protein [Pseudonocardia endophytica]